MMIAAIHAKVPMVWRGIGEPCAIPALCVLLRGVLAPSLRSYARKGATHGCFGQDRNGASDPNASSRTIREGGKTSIRGSPLCSVFQRNNGGWFHLPWSAPDPASLRQEAELGKRDEVDHLAGTHLIDLLRNLDQAIRLAQRGNQPGAITRELCDLQLSSIRPR
jgi:hypothetical protein